MHTEIETEQLAETFGENNNNNNIAEAKRIIIIEI